MVHVLKIKLSHATSCSETFKTLTLQQRFFIIFNTIILVIGYLKNMLKSVNCVVLR